jgi:hypothetical protein
MSLDTHFIDLSLTESQTYIICSLCIKVILISWASIGSQEICYTQNNYNEFNVKET